MRKSEPQRLITCIVPQGHALPVLKSLKAEHNVITANIHRARGAGRMTPLAWRGVGETSEKDVMDVIVNESDAETVFQHIYFGAGIDQPHGGIIYQQRLKTASSFELPDLPEEA